MLNPYPRGHEHKIPGGDSRSVKCLGGQYSLGFSHMWMSHLAHKPRGTGDCVERGKKKITPPSHTQHRSLVEALLLNHYQSKKKKKKKQTNKQKKNKQVLEKKKSSILELGHFANTLGPFAQISGNIAQMCTTSRFCGVLKHLFSLSYFALTFCLCDVFECVCVIIFQFAWLSHPHNSRRREIFPPKFLHR